MPADSKLLPTDHSVGHTWVIWIDNKASTFEISSPLLVEQQAAVQHTIDSLEYVHIEYRFAMLIDDIVIIKAGLNLLEHQNHRSLDPHI